MNPRSKIGSATAQKGVVDHSVAKGCRRDLAVLGSEDLDDRVATRPVAPGSKFALQTEDFLLHVGQKGGRAGFRALALRRSQCRCPQLPEAGDRLEEVTRSCGHGGLHPCADLAAVSSRQRAAYS